MEVFNRLSKMVYIFWYCCLFTPISKNWLQSIKCCIHIMGRLVGEPHNNISVVLQKKCNECWYEHVISNALVLNLIEINMVTIIS